jgi:hypothetical protein
MMILMMLARQKKNNWLKTNLWNLID